MARQRSWRATLSLVILGAWTSAAGADSHLAGITVSQPAAVAGHFLSHVALHGSGLPPTELTVRVPEDDSGCSDVAEEQATRQVVLILSGDGCSAAEKARLAKRAGASMVIISSKNVTASLAEAKDKLTDASVGVPVVVLPNATAAPLLKASRSEAVVLSVVKYEPSPLTISEGLLICLAAALVALGANVSTLDLFGIKGCSPPTEDGNVGMEHAQTMELDWRHVVGLAAGASFMLVFLFFFMKWVVYLMILGFALGGTSCLAGLGGMILEYYMPALQHKPQWRLPCVGTVAHAEIMAGIPCLGLAICWIFLRNSPYGWPFQDLLGLGFLCWIQHCYKFMRLKMIAMILVVMFCFDIFWVFLSPIFFHQSVMVQVATGGGTGETIPMLLRLPCVGDPFGSDRMIGFGDVALPGLLVSYLRRYDVMTERLGCRGYYYPALFGYFAGLNATVAALVIMRMGQPALLYLVPGTLGTTVLLALCRGELRFLWEGIIACSPKAQELLPTFQTTPYPGQVYPTPQEYAQVPCCCGPGASGVQQQPPWLATQPGVYQQQYQHPYPA